VNSEKATLPAWGLPIAPSPATTGESCRVLLLAQDTAWCTRFKSLAKHLGFRLKRLDSPVEVLMQFHEYDPHLFVVGEFRQSDLSLTDICDALRVPRVVRPLALLVTTEVPIPAGEDLAELGVDEVFRADAPPEDYTSTLMQHFKLAVAQRTVLDRERDILDSLPDALIVVDSDLVLWKVNRAFAGLFGLDQVEALRRHLGQPLAAALQGALGEKAAGEELAAALTSALRGGKTSFECRELLCGAERFLAGQITRLESNARHALVALRDVTDHEQALLRAARRERLATIGNLSVGVAHEIQNPNTFSRVNAANLRTLLAALEPMIAELARRSPEATIGALPLPKALQSIAEAVAGIEKASDRIAAVLETLKSFGQTAGDSVVSVDVHTSVNEAAFLTKHVLKGRARLTVDLPEDLPTVKAAASELSQVFINLIENACQAFEFAGPQARGDGPAEIRVHLEQLDERELTVAVTDNGPGIDESLQARIFRPYFTTREQGVGTGLGLSLSSDILHRFGGDLTVRSRRGQGATFLITLQRADGPSGRP
jgi:PAS domain S-box-containing protein